MEMRAPARDLGLAAAVAATSFAIATSGQASSHAREVPELFVAADQCQACHNGLFGPSGQQVSLGSEWHSSIMANSAKDPYWQAAVRREVLDHPQARGEIEHECSKCHMPMANFQARAGGGKGQVFAHLPIGRGQTQTDLLAADGASCTVCHQIAPDRLGTPASFTGGFLVDTHAPLGKRQVFGPFDVDRGRATIMQSATGLQPAPGRHVQRSELCATCHTLYTDSLGADGRIVGRLPEQVPYLEWLHSGYKNTASCQACHMAVVDGEMPITSVWGQPRAGLSRHDFLGGNAFMLRLLNSRRSELGVTALPQELADAADKTAGFLQSRSARVSVSGDLTEKGRLRAVVLVENLTGHKLPTAYPSRRAWIHLLILDRNGKTVFESGRLDRIGLIEGNDNDADAGRFEPHHDVIETGDQVQIYESVMATPNGQVTTGLLAATHYVKDNRLLPSGFVKASAHPDIRVLGHAADDLDFMGGGDAAHYSVDVSGAEGPFVAKAELYYQSIGYRWAQNLRAYGASETRRLGRYYRSMSTGSAVVLAHAEARFR